MTEDMYSTQHQQRPNKEIKLYLTEQCYWPSTSGSTAVLLFECPIPRWHRTGWTDSHFRTAGEKNLSSMHTVFSCMISWVLTFTSFCQNGSVPLQGGKSCWQSQQHPKETELTVHSEEASAAPVLCTPLGQSLRSMPYALPWSPS